MNVLMLQLMLVISILIDVTNAVLHTKKGKTDGHERLCSDNINNAHHSLFIVMLALIYNTMLVHGLSPDSMILGTMVPIPTNRC